jgi:hypothetical protein
LLALDFVSALDEVAGIHVQTQIKPRHRHPQNEKRPRRGFRFGRTCGAGNMSTGLEFRQAVFFHGVRGGIRSLTQNEVK